MRGLISLFLASCLFFLYGSTPAQATSLKVAPTHYAVSLKAGEKRKGYVDFSNDEHTSVVVRLRVQAFRQIDDNGGLEFYDNDQIRAGITLDYQEIQLGPRETVHLAFMLDSTRLPAGDSFAAIFANAEDATASAAAKQTAQVGALLSITNGTPSQHAAQILSLSTQWLQVGDGLAVTTEVRNTGDVKLSTGFYPTLTMTAFPYAGAERHVKSPLVFSGRTRTASIVEHGNFIGPIWISIKTGDSSKSQLVFALTGYWRVLAPLLLAIALLVYALRKINRRV